MYLLSNYLIFMETEEYTVVKKRRAERNGADGSCSQCYAYDSQLSNAYGRATLKAHLGRFARLSDIGPGWYLDHC